MEVYEEIPQKLTEWDIPFQMIAHEPAYTMRECAACEEKLDGMMPKNLFLRPRRAQQYFLLLMPGDVPYNASLVSHQAGVSRLGFAEEEALTRLLRTRPGSISPMGLIYDTDRQVTLLVDEALYAQPRLLFHPCDNRYTLALSGEDFFSHFLPACGQKVLSVKAKP